MLQLLEVQKFSSKVVEIKKRERKKSRDREKRSGMSGLCLSPMTFLIVPLDLFFLPLSILYNQQWLTACGSNGRSFACPGGSPSWSVSICILFFVWRLSTADCDLGEDLAGNTFWEFKDVMNAARFRRIVRFDPKTHFSDVQVTREFRRRMQARAWTTCLYSGGKGERDY